MQAYCSVCAKCIKRCPSGIDAGGGGAIAQEKLVEVGQPYSKRKFGLRGIEVN